MKAFLVTCVSALIVASSAFALGPAPQNLGSLRFGDLKDSFERANDTISGADFEDFFAAEELFQVLGRHPGDYESLRYVTPDLEYAENAKKGGGTSVNVCKTILANEDTSFAYPFYLQAKTYSRLRRGGSGLDLQQGGGVLSPLPRDFIYLGTIRPTDDLSNNPYAGSDEFFWLSKWSWMNTSSRHEIQFGFDSGGNRDQYLERGGTVTFTARKANGNLYIKTENPSGVSSYDVCYRRKPAYCYLKVQIPLPKSNVNRLNEPFFILNRLSLGVTEESARRVIYGNYYTVQRHIQEAALEFCANLVNDNARHSKCYSGFYATLDSKILCGDDFHTIGLSYYDVKKNSWTKYR